MFVIRCEPARFGLGFSGFGSNGPVLEVSRVLGQGLSGVPLPVSEGPKPLKITKTGLGADFRKPGLNPAPPALPLKTVGH